MTYLDNAATTKPHDMALEMFITRIFVVQRLLCF